MKYHIRNSLITVVASLLTVSALLSSSASASGTATLSLTPSSGSYTVGSIIAVGIYEDSGTDSVNSVQANLTYNSSLLSCSSSGITSSAAYNLSLQNSCGGGSVQIARAANPAVTGSQLVATVSFTATAAGTASVSFASGSGVARSTDHGAETLTTVGASYTITSPPPSGGGTGSGSGSSGSSGSSGGNSSGSTSKSSGSSSTPSSTSSSSNSTAAPAAVTVSDIAVTNLSDKTATVTWKTSAPTTSEVDYGTTTHYLATATDSTLTTNHYVVLDPSNLLANTTFHFLVKGVDASHHPVSSSDQSFKTLVSAPAAKKSSGLTIWMATAAGVAVLLAVLAVFKLNLFRHHHGDISPKGPFDSSGGSGQVITPMPGGPTIITPISSADSFDSDGPGLQSSEPPTDGPLTASEIDAFTDG